MKTFKDYADTFLASILSFLLWHSSHPFRGLSPPSQGASWHKAHILVVFLVVSSSLQKDVGIYLWNEWISVSENEH